MPVATMGSAPSYAPTEPIQGGKLAQTHPLVNYRYARDPAESCATCKNFEPPGVCALVTGMIRPVDMCDLWDGDPSGQRRPVQAVFPGDGDEEEIPDGEAEAGSSQGAKKGWATRKGGGSSRAVFAKERPETDEERQVATFARSEPPQVRAQRVGRTPVEPQRAQIIRRAFGWQAERERGPVYAELLPASAPTRFRAALAECRRVWGGLLEAINQARDAKGRFASGGGGKGKKPSKTDQRFMAWAKGKGMSQKKAEKVLGQLDQALKGKGQLPSTFRYDKQD